MTSGEVVTPSGNDDVFGFDDSFTGVEPIAVHDGLQPRDGHALAKVGVDVLSEALEIIHNRGLPHEAVGLITVVGKVGKTALPVWRDQAKGIPALLVPGVRHTVFLEYERSYPLLLQGIGGGQACLACTDDHCRTSLD